MKRKTLFTAVTLVAALGSAAGAYAAGGPGERGHGGRAQMGPMGLGIPGADFATVDADGDGQVTQAEIDAAKAAWFDGIDANADGLVSAEELVAHAEAQRAQRMQEGAARMVEARDADGDGQLTLEELGTRPQQSMLERLDRDGDGMLSEDELQPRQGMMRDRMGEHRMRRGN